jgi:hypothetical protein
MGRAVWLLLVKDACKLLMDKAAMVRAGQAASVHPAMRQRCKIASAKFHWVMLW